MRLKENLYSIDKKLLLKSGQKASSDVLRKIADSAGNIRYFKVKNTFIAADIWQAFCDPRYQTIFLPGELNEKIARIILNLSLPEKIVKELANTKNKIPYTYRHILIISLLGVKMALDKNLRSVFNPALVGRLALLHDIGKSRIKPSILNKTTPLTRQERQIIRTHPLIGYVLLHYYLGAGHGEYDYVTYEHHERLDGSGYPRRLKRINRYSQLIAVVDVFDALMSRRPYRKMPYTLRATLDFLLDEAKRKRLNKKMIYLLISYVRKLKPSLKGLKVSTVKRDNPPAENMYGKTATS